MMSFLRAKKWYIAAAVVILPLFGLFAFGASASAPTDPVAARAYWSARIEAAGPAAAYHEFSADYAPLSFSITHPLAHVFGELLYEKGGIDGLTVCDPTFAFGCYHGFFLHAIADNGEAVIPQLDAACVSKYGPLGTGCQHGIGHGILEFTGSSGLVHALALCKKTTQLKDLFGCTSGVFMEYNTPILFSGTTASGNARALDPRDPHAPCDTIVPLEFRRSCYYEIGLWWNQVYNRDYAKIGTLCAAIAKDTEREACYLGLGSVFVPNAQYDPKGTFALCAFMPTAEGKIDCSAGGSWTLWAEPKTRAAAPQLCGLFTLQEDRDACASKAKLIDDHSA